jgi:hypothetical protein
MHMRVVEELLRPGMQHHHHAHGTADVAPITGQLDDRLRGWLAVLVRAKMRAALEKRRPDLVLPQVAWGKPWVIHCTAWGDGAEAVLRYLARYVFRFAITRARIVALDDAGVTVRHKHRKSARWCTMRLGGHEFHARLPPARATEGTAQGALLGALASETARSCSPRPSDAGTGSDNRRAEARRRRPGCVRRASLRRIPGARGTPVPVLQHRPPRACP